VGSAKISVLAVIDLDGTNVRLVVTGTLTPESQTALHPLIRLGRVLTPVTRVVVDLTGAWITEAAAVEALTRHAREGHTGHPSQQVRFVLPDPVQLADAEDLRQLRTEQRSWAAAGAETDRDSTVRRLNTAPARPDPAPTTAAVRPRTLRTFPDRRAAAGILHVESGGTQPAVGTQHAPTTAEPTGTVLPFRPPSPRRAARSRRTAPVADRTAPGRTTAR
jgi:hypothetical protein